MNMAWCREPTQEEIDRYEGLVMTFVPPSKPAASEQPENSDDAERSSESPDKDESS